METSSWAGFNYSVENQYYHEKNYELKRNKIRCFISFKSCFSEFSQARPEYGPTGKERHAQKRGRVITIDERAERCRTYGNLTQTVQKTIIIAFLAYADKGDTDAKKE